MHSSTANREENRRKHGTLKQEVEENQEVTKNIIKTLVLLKKVVPHLNFPEQFWDDPQMSRVAPGL